MSAALLAPPAPLEDIADVRGFAIAVVNKSPLVRNGELTSAERDEVVDEAVALIFELREDWDQARCARFSAYVLTYLPKRLVSWYRVNLRQSGRGRWSGSTGEYKYNGTVSLDDVAPGSADRVDVALTGHGPGS